MDYLKQAVYLYAIQLIQDDKTMFLCESMSNAIERIIGIGALDEGIDALFPEFYDDYDGFFWSFDKSSTVYPTYSGGKAFWWATDMKRARLLYLEMLLNRYSWDW